MQNVPEDHKDQLLQDKTVTKEQQLREAPQLRGAPHQEEIPLPAKVAIEEARMKTGWVMEVICFQRSKKLRCLEYWEL